MNSFDLQSRIKHYLFTGERVLWCGQPKPGLLLTSRDALLIPFSLLWGGFAIFWNIGVWIIPNDSQHIDWFFRLWGLPFLAIGLYMIVGRFFHDAHIRKSLIYAVTNQRVLMLRGTKVTSLEIDRLPRLELSEARDGTGTISFESDNWFFGGRNGFSAWVPALSGAARFFRIEDPRRVYELIRNQARS